MSSAFIPVWILGGPFLGLLLLSVLYQRGTSAASDRSVDRDLRRWRDSSDLRVPTFSDREGVTQYVEPPRSPELELIARMSGPISSGAISKLSGHVSAGAISRLSGHKSPGAISKLSRRVSPGAIAHLSGRKSPGAIAALSAPKSVGSIARLSDGWFVSSLFGLPLLTDSQRPLKPDETLLIDDRELPTAAPVHAPGHAENTSVPARSSRLG